MPFMDFIFDNTYQVDAKEAEDSVRSKYPKLLHEAETIELAFKDRGGKGRDKEYFTSHRILIKDGKGIGSKRKNYMSIPYASITAFSVQSAGALMDGDCEFSVWSTGGYPKISIPFSATNVDIYQVYQFLNAKIAYAKQRGNPDIIDPVPPNMDKKQSAAGNVIDWLGDNAKQIDAGECETKFKTEFPVLLGDEKVIIAFKSGRDTTCFTNKRILLVDGKSFFLSFFFFFFLRGWYLFSSSILFHLTHRHHFMQSKVLLERKLNSSQSYIQAFMDLVSKLLGNSWIAIPSSVCTQI